MSSDGMPRCVVKEDVLELFIDHFSWGWVTVMVDRRHVRGKRFGCVPFMPSKLPMGRNPTLHLHLYMLTSGSRGYSVEVSRFLIQLMCHRSYNLCRNCLFTSVNAWPEFRKGAYLLTDSDSSGKFRHYSIFNPDILHKTKRKYMYCPKKVTFWFPYEDITCWTLSQYFKHIWISTSQNCGLNIPLKPWSKSQPHLSDLIIWFVRSQIISRYKKLK